MAERVRLATDSVFRVAPRNILGLQAQKFKSNASQLSSEQVLWTHGQAIDDNQNCNPNQGM